MSNAANTETSPNVVVVDLDNPLKRGDQVIKSVALRRPLGGATSGARLVDLIHLDLIATSKVVPRISDPVITAPEFLGMEVQDCAAIAEAVAGFLLTKRQKTDAGLEA